MKYLRAGALWAVRKLLKAGDRLLGPLAARAGFRILVVYLERIGEMATALELYVKMGELGMRPRYRAVCVAPLQRVANPSYLDYWRPFVRIVSSPRLSALIDRAIFSRHLTYTPPGPRADGSYWEREDAMVEVTAEWERQGRPPILQLKPDHGARGRATLRELGMPDDAWFVAAHLREPGYLGETETSHRWHRNVHVETYLPAFDAIVERGGWVIRLGDPTMSPLPPQEHVIDYPHLDIRSDWMDVFLCAACRFMLGTTSGVVMVSHTFGVPYAGTNWVPFSTIPHSGRNVYIPKPHRWAREGRLLTFEEMLAPELFHLHDARRYAELGIEFLDNTAEEIEALTLELLGRLEGTVRYSPEDEELQDRYWKVMAHYSSDQRPRIGRDFLRAHADLLPPA